MLLYDFIKLSQAERAEHVWHIGDFLASCPQRGNLYNMGDFYAELLYDQERNKITEVRGFKTLSNLDPYLEHVEILQTLD